MWFLCFSYPSLADTAKQEHSWPSCFGCRMEAAQKRGSDLRPGLRCHLYQRAECWPQPEPSSLSSLFLHLNRKSCIYQLQRFFYIFSWMMKQRCLTWAVSLLAQQERETSDLILCPGCCQRGWQRRVIGVRRQLKGLPLELHQRLVTSSCTQTASVYKTCKPPQEFHPNISWNTWAF